LITPGDPGLLRRRCERNGTVVVREIAELGTDGPEPGHLKITVLVFGIPAEALVGDSGFHGHNIAGPNSLLDHAGSVALEFKVSHEHAPNLFGLLTYPKSVGSAEVSVELATATLPLIVLLQLLLHQSTRTPPVCILKLRLVHLLGTSSV